MDTISIGIDLYGMYPMERNIWKKEREGKEGIEGVGGEHER